MVDLEREGRTTLEEGWACGANSNLNYRGERFTLVCGLWAKLKSKQALRGGICLCRVRTETQFPARERSPFIIAGGKQSRLHTLARFPMVSCLRELTITASHCSFHPCSVSLSVCPHLPFPVHLRTQYPRAWGPTYGIEIFIFRRPFTCQIIQITLC